MAGWCEGVMIKIRGHSPDSSQVLGYATLLTAGSILLLLAGLTVAGIATGLVILAPLLILLSPILIPVGIVLFVTVAGLFSTGIFILGVALVVSWLYNYVRGGQPPGSDKVDYARMRIADTASHVKDYAREYSGYFQGKGRDAAPGA